MEHEAVRKTVIIMRGIPGSGKTSRARDISVRVALSGRTCETVSADDFFMVPVGNSLVYRFDPSKLGEAHAQCMARFLDCLLLRRDVVIVDNTHTKLWEFENYRRAAKLAGYECQVIEMEHVSDDGVKLFAERNTHGVPLEVVERMAQQYEKEEDAILS